MELFLFFNFEITEQFISLFVINEMYVPMDDKINLFWFRRDLRLEDNSGLSQALQQGKQVACLFIFDSNILDRLEDKDDARVSFIHELLIRINLQLKLYGSRLLVEHGDPLQVFKELTEKFSIDSVYTNQDYEPYAQERDLKISTFLQEKGSELITCKDQVIFEKDEVLKRDETPYTVYTPYGKKWLVNFRTDMASPYPSPSENSQFVPLSFKDVPSLEQIGFTPSRIKVPEANLSREMLTQYDAHRDIPSLNATSQLGPHLRFGSISIRQAVLFALQQSNQFLMELTWREFFMQILWHFPQVLDHSFRPAYDQILWQNNEEEFKRWCQGSTGYPIVDAGMRELKQTGRMHNRVRMVTACFLCKHLLIDWRWGEAWFARHLLDFELSSNNGNWQWAAGSGCDAAPYFRVFNPMTQQQKFDPDFTYIQQWVPEFGTPDYPTPIVDHKMARDRAITHYRNALQMNP